MISNANANNLKSIECFDLAANYHSVNASILRALAMKESSRCVNVISKNVNKTVDMGCMQINSIHIPELATYGVHPHDLADQCKNIFVGAWHYKKQVLKYGNNWIAVGSYHSKTPALRDAYANDVYRLWLKYFQ